MSFLAIDQSTSATKAILFDAAGQMLAQSSREHRQHYPHPGWVEHDAEEIWQNLLMVWREVTSQQSDAPDTISGVSITNQRETVVVFDRRTGTPLHHAIVWQCRRGDSVCDELREAGCDQLVVSKTGLKLDTYFSAPKLKWLLGQHPEIRRKVRTGEALIGTIDTYLIYRLTAGQVFATDHTNASRTLLFDVERLCWDEQLCQMFDVPITALPEVRDSFALFGSTDRAAVVGQPLPICGVMGDSQASLFAHRCHRPGTVKATFGSGTSVLLNVGEHYQAPGQGSVLALAWVHRGVPTYALEGIINYSSATVAWLKDQLRLLDDAGESAALAAAVADSGGVYFIPAFSGLGAPHWRPEARAAILGMTAFTRKEHVVRAALEAISYQIRDALTMLQQDAGVTPRRLHADGGPTQNEFLMQFTADVLELELAVSQQAHLSALGAALAGMLGMGIFNSLEEVTRLTAETRTYTPQMSHQQAIELHRGWQAAVQRVL